MASVSLGARQRLLSELEGFPDAAGDKYATDSINLCDRNFNVACESV